VHPYIGTTIHPKLILASEPTIRVWLYLVIRDSKSTTIVTTAKAIADSLRAIRPTSKRAASQAIKELEELGLVSVKRVGRAMEITIPSIQEMAA
jgi:hypothetical protein